MSIPVDPASLLMRRRLLAAGIGLLLFLSLVLPHVGIQDQTGPGRSLLPAGVYFLNVQAAAFGPAGSSALAFALNVTYLGIALHQFGLLLALVTFWIVAAEDINRWLWRMMVVAGWLLAVGAVISVVGGVLIGAAGVPALLGYAWLPALLAGVALIISARRAKDRIDYSWFQARPELQ
ncbi:MAG: hypothetical protein JWN06_2730 [Propionibacteriaceae bacterium]|nr:hypothetical protein [Propionibacteriaceae bacterium]